MNFRTGLLKGHKGRIWSIAFSPSGSLLASGGEDKTVRIWHVNNGHPYSWYNEERSIYNTLEEHTSWVMSVKFIDDRTLASCSDDCSIKIWDLEKGECIETFPLEHKNRIWSIDFDRVNLRLASGSEDRMVCLWDYEIRECLNLLQGYNNKICSIAFCPDSSILASGSDDRFIRIWDDAPNVVEPIKYISGHDDRVWSVTFSPNGEYLASGGCDKIISIWEVKKDYKLINTLVGHSNWVWSIAFDPNSKRLASTGDDRDIKLWNIYESEPYQTISVHKGRVWSIAFSPDGKKLAAGGEDNIIRIWYLEDEECVELEGHKGWIRSICFSSNGNYLVSGSEDKTIRIWDAAVLRTWSGGTHKAKPELWKTLTGHRGRVRSVSLSSDSVLLASGGDDNTVIVWDIKSGTFIKKYENHTGPIEAVAFNFNNSRLASGSEDETIQIWDIKDIEPQKILSIHKPYQGMNIHQSRGLKDAERLQLRTLGCIDD
jgi:WD40 repeat protein